MSQAKQLILHGAIILLAGLLCGAPFGSAIVRQKPAGALVGTLILVWGGYAAL